MKRWLVSVGVLLTLAVSGPATGKDDGKEPYDLGKAQMVTPVRQCIDGCLRDDEGRAVVHLHFTFTCGLCGTAVDVLIFSGIDDQGVEWLYSAMFSNRKATSAARRRMGISPMVRDDELIDCIRRHELFPDISEGGRGYER
jgi:hypothetical protein